MSTYLLFIIALKFFVMIAIVFVVIFFLLGHFVKFMGRHWQAGKDGARDDKYIGEWSKFSGRNGN